MFELIGEGNVDLVDCLVDSLVGVEDLGAGVQLAVVDAHIGEYVVVGGAAALFVGRARRRGGQRGGHRVLVHALARLLMIVHDLEAHRAHVSIVVGVHGVLGQVERTRQVVAHGVHERLHAHVPERAAAQHRRARACHARRAHVLGEQRVVAHLLEAHVELVEEQVGERLARLRQPLDERQAPLVRSLVEGRVRGGRERLDANRATLVVVVPR